MLTTCLTVTFKNVFKILMMLYNVAKNGDKYMIGFNKLSILLKPNKNGHSSPTQFSHQSRPLFNAVQNLYKFAKDNYSLL
jgi:hypothetical protein